MINEFETLLVMSVFPYIRQVNEIDCGVTCLCMIAKFYGRPFNIDSLRVIAGFDIKEGVSLFGLAQAAKSIRLRTRCVQLTFLQLLKAQIPSILHWDGSHFVVFWPTENSNTKFLVGDPWRGLLTLTKEQCLQHWLHGQAMNSKFGIALLVAPASAFLKKDER